MNVLPEHREFLLQAQQHPEYQYLDILQELRGQAMQRPDRTGVGVYGVFGRQMRFDLSQGFPLLTTKRLHFRSIVAELLWFLSGSTNAKDLGKMGCSIWDEWAAPDGELGPVYGKQWRSWAAPDGRSIDQIANLIRGLQTDPYSRRHVVSAWNPADIENMALPPCHCLFQFYVSEGKLSCQLYQRSADFFLGVPFNIASYSLLTLMIAKSLGYEPGEFIHTLGDTHLYANHLDQADKQLGRVPKPLPVLLFERRESLFDYKLEDFLREGALEGYEPEGHIRAPIAV